MAIRLMTRKTLREYVDQPRNAAAKEPMLLWASILEHSTWGSFGDVKATFPASDLLVDNRVCFDIESNKWRIIADVHFKRRIAYIVWIGTHAEYDKL